jgi:thiol-disulfide isomerase/thioredoxin
MRMFRRFCSGAIGAWHRVTLARLLAVALACMAPSIHAANLESLDLDRFKGKVVLLDFWASWCAPCKASFPWMQQLQERYAGHDLVVIAVNVDHERTLAERFLREQRADFPIVFDPLGRIAERFDVHSMPASFYIDRTGKVRYTHAGFRNDDKADAERELSGLIAEH